MRILQAIGALLILFASPAMAKEAAAAWIVTQKSGEVRVIRNGMQPASINVRAALAPGDMIATGANGRAMLTKGDDYVVIAPASQLVLPKEPQQTGFTRLIQQFGTLLYKVKRTGAPHFEVKTPMLAAVVKGTTFTVVVDQKGAGVQVTEGIVEVSALTGDARRLVEGGTAVYIGRERPQEIIEIKFGTAGLPDPVAADGTVEVEGSGDVSLTTISNLSDGLVRAAPVALVASVAPAANPVTTTLGGATAAPIVPLASEVDSLQVEPDLVVDLVGEAVTESTAPVLGVVDTAVPAAIDLVANGVETAVPALSDPVIDVVDAVVPVVEPLVEIVDAVVPVVEPVVEIVDAVVPVVEPVVEIVDAVVPVVEPVVEIVDAVVPVVTQPLPEIICLPVIGC